MDGAVPCCILCPFSTSDHGSRTAKSWWHLPILSTSCPDPPWWLCPLVNFGLCLLSVLPRHACMDLSFFKGSTRPSMQTTTFLVLLRWHCPYLHHQLNLLHIFLLTSFNFCGRCHSYFSAANLAQALSGKYLSAPSELRSIIPSHNFRQPSAFSSSRQVVAKENTVFHKFCS